MGKSKLTPKKSYELVMEDLQRQIESGLLKPGDRLDSVVSLAEQYGFGRSTVREALGALKAMGMIDIRHGGGTFVKAAQPEAKPSLSLLNQIESISEILEVRKMIEPQAAAMAALRHSPEQLNQLDQALQQMKQSQPDESESEQADIQFHLYIAHATHNQLLISVMESISHQLHHTIRDTRKLWLFGQVATAQRLLEEHQHIFAAIRDRDEEQASRLMLAHLVYVEAALQKYKP